MEEKEVKQEGVTAGEEGKKTPTDTVLVVSKGTIDPKSIFKKIDNYIGGK